MIHLLYKLRWTTALELLLVVQRLDIVVRVWQGRILFCHSSASGAERGGVLFLQINGMSV